MNKITKVLQTYQPHNASSAQYFAPLLPWQQKHWAQMISNMDRMAHGVLFAGMKGIGKHAFMWHLTAWMLCDSADKGTDVACGSCQSCLWLKAGTHPNLMVLPARSALLTHDEVDESHQNNPTKNGKIKAQTTTSKSKPKSKPNSKSKKSKKGANSHNLNQDDITPDKIKIDEIRALTPFVSKSSRGRRICIIDNADNMTIGAANALLKTLEEPFAGVHLFLLSDMPAKLLPTITSRVQKAPIDTIDTDEARTFLHQIIQSEDKHQPSYDIEQVNQLLNLASGAPLAALALIDKPWYRKRKLWLTTWLALRANKRSSTAASDYWQQQLSLSAFVQLTEVMLMDIKRVCLGMPAQQHDIGLDKLESIEHIDFEDLQQVTNVITDIKLAVYQNVQEKLGYDKLMAQLAHM